MEKLLFRIGCNAILSSLGQMIKMAPHAAFVEGTFERMKAKQTELFKERKQSKTKCKLLKNIRDNFHFFFFNLEYYFKLSACPFNTCTNGSQQSSVSSNLKLIQFRFPRQSLPKFHQTNPKVKDRLLTTVLFEHALKQSSL